MNEYEAQRNFWVKQWKLMYNSICQKFEFCARCPLREECTKYNWEATVKTACERIEEIREKRRAKKPGHYQAFDVNGHPVDNLNKAEIITTDNIKFVVRELEENENEDVALTYGLINHCEEVPGILVACFYNDASPGKLWKAITNENDIPSEGLSAAFYTAKAKFPEFFEKKG